MLNGLVDFFLLMGTNALAGFPMQYRRMAGAAALGAVYSGFCLMPGFRFLGSILWRTVFLGLMGLLAFGWNRSSLKRTGIFLLLSMAMGGIAVSLGKGSGLTLMLSATALWILCRISFGGKVDGKEYVPVKIRYENREVQVLALRDTGNCLTDPVTGEQVLVLGTEPAIHLTGLSRKQLASPLETLGAGSLPGLRLIPYCSVGKGSGMLLAMRFREVTIGGRKQEAIVAFDPGGLGGEQMYQALTGGVS